METLEPTWPKLRAQRSLLLPPLSKPRTARPNPRRPQKPPPPPTPQKPPTPPPPAPAEVNGEGSQPACLLVHPEVEGGEKFAVPAIKSGNQLYAPYDGKVYFGSVGETGLQNARKVTLTADNGEAFNLFLEKLMEVLGHHEGSYNAFENEATNANIVWNDGTMTWTTAFARASIASVVTASALGSMAVVLVYSLFQGSAEEVPAAPVQTNNPEKKKKKKKKSKTGSSSSSSKK